jgi:hypothetical protein
MSVAPQEMPTVESTPEDEIVLLSNWNRDPVTAADLLRSEANLRAWRSYLPEDCVAMMVQMGWDKST